MIKYEAEESVNINKKDPLAYKSNTHIEINLCHSIFILYAVYHILLIVENDRRESVNMHYKV